MQETMNVLGHAAMEQGYGDDIPSALAGVYQNMTAENLQSKQAQQAFRSSFIGMMGIGTVKGAGTAVGKGAEAAGWIKEKAEDVSGITTEKAKTVVDDDIESPVEKFPTNKEEYLIGLINEHTTQTKVPFEYFEEIKQKQALGEPLTTFEERVINESKSGVGAIEKIFNLVLEDAKSGKDVQESIDKLVAKGLDQNTANELKDKIKYTLKQKVKKALEDNARQKSPDKFTEADKVEINEIVDKQFDDTKSDAELFDKFMSEELGANINLELADKNIDAQYTLADIITEGTGKEIGDTKSVIPPVIVEDFKRDTNVEKKFNNKLPQKMAGKVMQYLYNVFEAADMGAQEVGDVVTNLNANSLDKLLKHIGMGSINNLPGTQNEQKSQAKAIINEHIRNTAPSTMQEGSTPFVEEQVPDVDVTPEAEQLDQEVDVDIAKDPDAEVEFKEDPELEKGYKDLIDIALDAAKEVEEEAGGNLKKERKELEKEWREDPLNKAISILRKLVKKKKFEKENPGGIRLLEYLEKKKLKSEQKEVAKQEVEEEASKIVDEKPAEDMTEEEMLDDILGDEADLYLDGLNEDDVMDIEESA